MTIAASGSVSQSQSMLKLHIFVRRQFVTEIFAPPPSRRYMKREPCPSTVKSVNPSILTVELEKNLYVPLGITSLEAFFSLHAAIAC